MSVDDEAKNEKTKLRRPQDRPEQALQSQEPAAPATAWVEPDLNAPLATDLNMIGVLLSGRYLLERKLGEGGMGTVYLARDQEVSGESFAIKVLRAEIQEYPESLALLREEVRTTRALRHPDIVGVYSLNADGRNVYMLMEYLEGKPLNELLDKEFGRGMPFGRAWPLIEDVCGALAFAHDHSVIHSDIKPSNVFVTSGRAKVLDFGIARVSRKREGRIDPGSLGALTPAYASCEMLNGAEPDQSDDVYALACVIYEMLSGKHPFGKRSAVEAKDARLAVPRIPSLTARQNAGLAQALAFDRAARTPSVEALLEGLDPTSSAQEPAKGSASPRLPRTYLWSAAGVLVLAGSIAGGWLLVGKGNKPADKVVAVAHPSGVPATTVEEVQVLAGRAHLLEVDPNDASLKQGMAQLSQAQAQLNAGSQQEADRSLHDALAALQNAILSGQRLAHVGSGPDAVSQAIALCRRSGANCSAGDFDDEAPRTVALAPFALDATEVTNADFAEFVAANQYVTGAERTGGLFATKGSVGVFRPHESWKTLRDSVGRDATAAAYPVRGIDFKSASDYCRWRNERLPTESEWEYVARGADHRIFASGNDAPPVPAASAGLLPANEQPATGLFGAHGLGDGLLEWVDGGSASERVLRGASWLDQNPVNRRLAMRRLTDPAQALVDSGVRCARSIDSWPRQETGEAR
jgi:hypothetical protein